MSEVGESRLSETRAGLFRSTRMSGMKGPLLCLHVHTCDKGAKEALWPWTASKDQAAYEVIIFPVPCPPSRRHSQSERRTPCPSASNICCRRGSASWQNNDRRRRCWNWLSELSASAYHFDVLLGERHP